VKKKKISQIRFLAKHSQPICFIRTNSKMLTCFSISNDGFLLSVSLVDGRYLKGFGLGMSDPSELIVTKNAYVGVVFNGAGSALVKVFDWDLREVSSVTLEMCIDCWTFLEDSGIEWLLIVLRNKRVIMARIPDLLLLGLELELPFRLTCCAWSNGEALCYCRGEEGECCFSPFE
jgi:hypothetical protein